MLSLTAGTQKVKVVKSLFLLAAICAIVYAPSLLNGFVQDDALFVWQNDFTHSLNNLPKVFTKAYFTPGSRFSPEHLLGSGEVTYRPIATLSYFVDYACWKLNPLGYHLTSILLQILTVWLLLWLALILLGELRPAFLAALIFAIHPINNEAVNVIAFRKDLFTCLFFLVGFLSYIKSDQTQGAKRLFIILLSAIFFFLAVLAKEMAIVFPFILILYDAFWNVEKIRTLKPLARIRRYAPFFLALLLYLLVCYLLKNNLDDFVPMFRGGSFYSNTLIVFNVIAIYLRWIIWPIDIHVALTEPFQLGFPYTLTNPQNFTSLMVVLGLIVAAFSFVKKNRILSFSIFWFLITLVPASNIIPLPTLIASHFLYLPMVGVAIFVAELCRGDRPASSRWISPPFAQSLTRIFLGTFIVMCLLITPIRNAIWQSNLSLWRECVRIYPQDFRAHLNYAIELKQIDGLFDKAVREFQIAAFLAPTNTIPLNSLGIAYKEKGDSALAVASFEKAIQLNPRDLSSYINLAWTHIKFKQWPEAERVCQSIEKINPAFAERYEILGTIAFEQGQFEETSRHLEKATQLEPGNERYWSNLGVAYFKINDLKIARLAWEKALTIRPNDPATKSFLKLLDASAKPQATAS